MKQLGAKEIPGNLEALPEQPIETNLSITDDLFVKWFQVQKAETFIPQHAHEHDHVTVLATGSIDVWIDGIYTGRRHAPDSIVIKAGVFHTFKTLEDNTVMLCVHALDGEGEPRIMKENQLVEVPTCPSV